MCSERARGNGRKRSGADLRSEFEKDYHRIISSASFRRLQDKTQVFPLDKSDFIRTRLTHSLEVSSFARSIGQNIASRIIEDGVDETFTAQTKEDICAVLECAGLLHDIGNPPFGHFGEDAIRDWFRTNLKSFDYLGRPVIEILSEQMLGDFYHFEGNTQALRVVTKLHFMVDENGMNLTNALLATIIKYPGSSLEINYDKKDPNRDVARKKMGYFYADREVFHRVESECGLNGRRHPLCFALEAADDIAYRTADIEDAIKKKCIDLNTLTKELKAAVDAARIMEFAERGEQDWSDMINQTDTIIGKLQNYYERAIDAHYEDPELYAVQNWLVRVQGMLIACATDCFMEHYDEIMSGTFKRELLAMSKGSLLLDTLGDIAYRYAFVSGPIIKLEVAADTIFDFLLSKLVKALIYYDTDMWKDRATAVDSKMIALISPTFMQVYRLNSDGCSGEEKLYLRLLLATDYVSGMTDSYAKRLYQELNGIS